MACDLCLLMCFLFLSCALTGCLSHCYFFPELWSVAHISFLSSPTCYLWSLSSNLCPLTSFLYLSASALSTCLSDLSSNLCRLNRPMTLSYDLCPLNSALWPLSSVFWPLTSLTCTLTSLTSVSNVLGLCCQMSCKRPDSLITQPSNSLFTFPSKTISKNYIIQDKKNTSGGEYILLYLLYIHR